MCTGTHLCFSQAHFRTFSAPFPPFSAFCSHFSPVTVCFVKINISFGEIRFLPVYSKRDRRAPVSFETVKKVCHCEPVRRLAWQSVSKTHNSCTFPQISSQKVTDSHTSDIGHWFGMTGVEFIDTLKRDRLAPVSLVYDTCQIFCFSSTTSRSTAANSSSGIAPRSSPRRVRTETVPASISRSPTTSM